MNYHNITKDDMLNGDGIRVVLWCSGCEHHCNNCQNPQTWDFNSGIPFDDETKKELFEELKKDYIAGITFSGGDPLNCKNISIVLSLIRELKHKFPNKTIWLYSGYTFESIMKPIVTDELDIERDKAISTRQEILKNIDVFVDGKYVEELRDITLKWRGSSNQRVINVQESLKQNKIILWCD